MTAPERRLQIDLLTARYLEAFEQDDHDTMTEIWERATTDDELTQALVDLHQGLQEEREAAQAERERRKITTNVAQHLPSAEIVGMPSAGVTVGAVAEELFRHTPGQLSAAAHQLNEQLRGSREPLPKELGLSKLVAWAEERFGKGPSEYWKAFRQAALKLEMARTSEIEYQMAARKAPRRPEEPR